MPKNPFSGDGSKRALLDEETTKAQCEQHPAGYPVEESDGSDACLFIYDGDEPIKNVEVENITPESVEVKHKDTGETEKLEI